MLNEIAKGKLTFYKKENYAIHLVLNNAKFYNGIIKNIQPDSLILDDEKDGVVIIFYSEIFDISKRRDKI